MLTLPPVGRCSAPRPAPPRPPQPGAGLTAGSSVEAMATRHQRWGPRPARTWNAGAAGGRDRALRRLRGPAAHPAVTADGPASPGQPFGGGRCPVNVDVTRALVASLFLGSFYLQHLHGLGALTPGLLFVPIAVGHHHRRSFYRACGIAPAACFPAGTSSRASTAASCLGRPDHGLRREQSRAGPPTPP
jgi:hypothetical protein